MLRDRIGGFGATILRQKLSYEKRALRSPRDAIKPKAAVKRSKLASHRG
jgi:hypothetical protein